MKFDATRVNCHKRCFCFPEGETDCLSIDIEFNDIGIASVESSCVGKSCAEVCQLLSCPAS